MKNVKLQGHELLNYSVCTLCVFMACTIAQYGSNRDCNGWSSVIAIHKEICPLMTSRWRTYTSCKMKRHTMYEIQVK